MGLGADAFAAGSRWLPAKAILSCDYIVFTSEIFGLFISPQAKVIPLRKKSKLYFK